ncbi:MAG TPA: Ig-like domain-containing protein [Candidatus Thermoplasmatota archaeon]|nr:Ig-like domain-containing protein [Candidatus Thermoplasmatota archaeon]
MARRLWLGLLLAAGAVVLLSLGADAATERSVTIGCGPAWPYSPSPIVITVGDSVRWSNPASQAPCQNADHTATADEESAFQWNTGSIPVGGSSQPVVFNVVGTFQYVCQFHSSMLGTVTVQASQDAPPSVTIAKPVANEEVSGAYKVEGTASSDATNVWVTVDDGIRNAATRQGTAWSWTWDTSALTPGSSHALKAIASDGAQEGESTVVTVKIAVPDALPVVVIGTPEASGEVEGNLTVSGTASDDNGVAKVEVQVDDGAWNAATGTTTWTWTWNTRTVPNGTHNLTARATDTAGKLGTVKIPVVVKNPPAADAAPTILLTHPVSGSKVRGFLTVFGNATDDIAVVGVDVRVDEGAWVSASGTAPFQLTIDTTVTPNGTHNLTARARDSTGHVTLSTVVPVIVDNPVEAVALTLEGTNGTEVAGVVTIRGVARGLLAVEVRVDNVSRETVVPSAGAWTWAWDTREFADGVHGVDIRAARGGATYLRGPVYFVVENVGEGTDDDGAEDDGGEDTGGRPRVTSFEPADGVSVAGAISFKIVATDPDGDPVHVRLYVDDALLAESDAPLDFTWPAVDARLGRHAVRAETCDARGCGEPRTWAFTVVASSVDPSETTDDDILPPPEDGGGPATAAETQDDTPLPPWTALLAFAAAGLVARRRR